MLKRNLILVILSFTLCAYDPPFIHLKGVIVDHNTSNPITKARISLSENVVLYTDSSGNFKLDRVGSLDSQEMLVEKNGYKPKFIDFSKEKYEMGNAVIKLQPTTKAYKPRFSQNALRLINTLIKIAFSLFNAFTLLFILFQKRIRRQLLWILGIMIINPAFCLLYFDFSLINFKIINGSFYLFNYWNNPYSLLIAIPLISMVFWILYLIKRDCIHKKNQDSEITQN